MRKLSERLYHIIMPSIRSEATFNKDEIIFWFEEQLYFHEYDIVEKFLDWCVETKQNAVSGDVMEISKEYFKTLNK